MDILKLAAKITFLLYCILVWPVQAVSQNKSPDNQYFKIDENQTFVYRKPAPFAFIKNGFRNIIGLGRASIDKNSLKTLSWVTASTAALIYYDQDITDESQRFGRRMHIGNDNFQKTLLTVKGYTIFQGPTDLGSSLYFLGDGWTHMSIAFSILGYGLLKHNYRALSTFSQLAEGMIATGSSTQILKHITGRESPFVSTKARGRWRFFPDQLDYMKHVPSYDAFPSGHLATASMTFYVISRNYPDKKFVKPLGYTLLTLLGYQMLNNGVHWISDYPLALAIGYTSGKMAVERGRKVITNDSGRNEAGNNAFSNLHFSVNRLPGNGYAMSLTYQF